MAEDRRKTKKLSLGDRWAGFLGGKEKLVARLLERLPDRPDQHQLEEAIGQLRAAGIDDANIIRALYSRFEDPMLLIYAAVVNRKHFFPDFDPALLLDGWPWGEEERWQGFLQCARGEIGEAVRLLLGSGASPQTVKQLLDRYVPPHELINLSLEGRVVPLPELRRIMRWDQDALWSALRERRSFYDAAGLLLQFFRDEAADIILTNTEISGLVEELLAKSPDQGERFTELVELARYPLTDFWQYVLKYCHRDKEQAIRFVFLNGQNLLRPMLVEVMKAGTGHKDVPALRDIVAVFASESGAELDGEEPEVLTAGAVVGKLGWSSQDVWQACCEYNEGDIARTILLLSRHFPDQVQELVFQAMPLPEILSAVGEHYAAYPRRADLFCRRLKIGARAAYAAIITRHNSPLAATQWFSRHYPALAAQVLAEMLENDTEGQALVHAFKSRMWSPQSLWLALARLLDAGNNPEKVFNYAQRSRMSGALETVAQGMLEDGYRINDVLLALFSGSEGPLPALLTLARQHGLSERDVFRLFAHRGKEDGVPESGENPWLSDLYQRLPGMPVGLLFQELGAAHPELAANPAALVKLVLNTVPSLKSQGPPLVKQLWSAFSEYCGGVTKRLTETCLQAMASVMRRDHTIKQSLETLILPQTAPPEAKDQITPPGELAYIAERLRLNADLFCALLSGEGSREFRRIAQATDRRELDLEDRTVLQYCGVSLEALKGLIYAQDHPRAAFPVKTVAEAFGLSVSQVNGIIGE